MSDDAAPPGEMQTSLSLQEQLQKAASDLWSTTFESGKEYVVFMDHRRLQTKVQRLSDGMYHVSWEPEADDGEWIRHARPFADLREAAFHGFQGPH